jgi:hypothetical protein
MPEKSDMLALFGGSSVAILNAETSLSKNCALTGSDHIFIGNTVVKNDTPAFICTIFS